MTKMSDDATIKKEAKRSPMNITQIEAEIVLNCLDFEILIVSEDFKILFANTAFLEKVGMKKEGVIGKHCYEITHKLEERCEPPDDPCPLQKVMATGKPAVELHKHMTKGNKKFFVNVTAAQINNEEVGRSFLHLALPAQEGIRRDEDIKSAINKTLDVLQVVSQYQKQMREVKVKTTELEKTKKELEEKIEQLEKFNKFAVGRELRMVELKDKIKELEKKCMPGQ